MSIYIKLSALLFIALVITSCSKAPEQPEQVVIAKVGDRTISLDEFIKRSEYTIRPPYAKGNHYIHKKIVLNSIIAEKLMALEAGDNNELAQNEQFQKYIQGRKEQAMRKWLFQNEGLEKVNLPAEKIANEYRWAGREYDVAFFTVPTKEQADSVQALLNDPSKSFEDIYNVIGGTGEVPTRQVMWQRDGNEAVVDAMYSDSLRVGQVLGPIKAAENNYIAIKILGWTETIAMSDEQVKLRYNDVKERLSRTEAEKIYGDFVLDVMKGK